MESHHFCTGARSFSVHLYYGSLKKCSNCSHQYEKITTLICVHSIHFHLLYFQWKSLMWKSLIFDFFISNQRPTKGMQSCVECGGYSTLCKNSSSFFEVHFHSILACQIVTLRRTCSVTDDPLLSEGSPILSLLSHMLQNHLNCSFRICYGVVNFIQTLGIYSTVCWGSSLQSIFLSEYFMLVKYPACFITIWSIFKMMITSVFSNVRRVSHQIRHQLFLRTVWYICYTILQHIFLLVWSLSLIECCCLKIEN